MGDFNARVWEAFWADGNNKAGLERAVAVVFSEAARIASSMAEDAPNAGYDNGATRDGWEMACKAFAARLSQERL